MIRDLWPVIRYYFRVILLGILFPFFKNVTFWIFHKNLLVSRVPKLFLFYFLAQYSWRYGVFLYLKLSRVFHRFSSEDIGLFSPKKKVVIISGKSWVSDMFRICRENLLVSRTPKLSYFIFLARNSRRFFIFFCFRSVGSSRKTFPPFLLD